MLRKRIQHKIAYTFKNVVDILHALLHALKVCFDFNKE